MTKDENTYLACVAKLGCYACRVYGGHTTKAKARATSSPFLAVPLCDEHAATLQNQRAWRNLGTTEQQALADTNRQLFARRFSNFEGK